MNGILFQDLVRKMLHVEPGRRPTSSVLLQHPWLSARNRLPTSRLITGEVSVVKGTVAATYRAVGPRAPNLGPVVMSELARRRRKSRPKSTAQV